MAGLPKILIIHEQEEHRDFFKDVLDPQQYETILVGDVDEAEHKLREFSVDLLVISLNLPNSGSQVLIGKLKEEFADIPFIITSKKRRVAALLECSELGSAGSIPYPYTKKNVSDIIAKVLEQAQKPSCVPDKSSFGSLRQIAEYQLKGVLGKGGMGTVYLAEKINAKNRKPYAIKVLQNPAKK